MTRFKPDVSKIQPGSNVLTYYEEYNGKHYACAFFIDGTILEKEFDTKEEALQEQERINEIIKKEFGGVNLGHLMR